MHGFYYKSLQILIIFMLCGRIFKDTYLIRERGIKVLGNFHTHTNFCDGKNSAEEIVLTAIDKGFASIGFSGHGYTSFDLSCCIKDMDGYKNEIKILKEKYKDKIQVYLGVEEDAFEFTNRNEFDYIIGSLHYIKINDKYYSTDASYDCFKECLKVFNYDVLKLAESYYSAFCQYILKRKPDIVGHFDVITKYDEKDEMLFLNNEEYLKISEKYLNQAIKSEAIFEVNTGAMARGHRSNPYPNENLLYILKKNNAKIILSSDSHSADSIDFKFKEIKKYLKDMGFLYTYVLHDGVFKKDYL